jgi:hypothetical protein
MHASELSSEQRSTLLALHAVLRLAEENETLDVLISTHVNILDIQDFCAAVKNAVKELAKPNKVD